MGAFGCATLLGGAALAAAGLLLWHHESVADLWDNVRAVVEEPQWAESMDTAEEVLELLAAHRDDVALVATTLGEHGGGAPPADDTPTDLAHRPNAVMPLASVYKVALLAAWADAAVAGRVAADEAVPVEQWHGWYLPGTDGGAHVRALDDLGIAHTRQGALTPAPAPALLAAPEPSPGPSPPRSVSMGGLVRAMVRFSDNAAADLLLDRLGPARVAASLSRAGLTTHTPIRWLGGTLLTWRNHEDDERTPGRIARLTDPATLDAELGRLRARWADPAWREDELDWRRRRMSLGRLRYQAEAAEATTPAASAADYARLMAAIATGTLISPAVAERARDQLQWPMEVGRNADRYEAFGSKGGSLPGILTEATYVVPREGDFAGRTRVVVLLTRRLPMSAWLRLTETYAQQYFVLRLATRADFAARVAAALSAAGGGG